MSRKNHQHQQYQNLNKVVEREEQKYLRRKSQVFLEMAVGDMLSTHSAKETKQRLLDYVEQLEEFSV